MPRLYNEQELEEYIIKTIGEEGNYNPITSEAPPTFVFNQVDLGSYGIADIITIDFNPTLTFPNNITEVNFTIIELKKGAIDLSAIAQISRYKQGLFNYFKYEHRVPINIDGMLVGNKLNMEDDSCYIIDSMGWLQYFEYSISMDKGISFKERSGWHKKNNNYNCLDELVHQNKKTFLDLHKAFLKEAYKYE